MSHTRRLTSLSDDELLDRLLQLVKEERRLEADLVAHIAEVDARRLYLARAASSMFTYACSVLHLSEAQAYLRITCARAARRFPVILDMLADGRLHLSAVAKLCPHLDEQNAEALLCRAVHKSKREIEALCAELAPRPDVASGMRKLPMAQPGPSTAGDRGRKASERQVADGLGPDGGLRCADDGTGPSSEPKDAARLGRQREPGKRPDVIEPLAPARYKVQFTASAEVQDKLCRARSLLRHKVPDGDLGEVIDEALTLLLAKLESKRFGKTEAPRKTLAKTDTSASSRYIPAAVRREVFARDEGQCAFVDQRTGRRCSCADPGQIEYHHVHPYSIGADHDPALLELRCRSHNQHQADLDFGLDKMQRHRTHTSRARQPRTTATGVIRGPEMARFAGPVARRRDEE